MAAALARSGLSLWVAWVAAAGLGTAAAVVVSVSAFGLAPAWGFGVVNALPVVLLQYVVLRVAVGVDRSSAALWATLSLLAALATPAIDSLWAFSFAPRLYPAVERIVPVLGASDFTLGGLRVIDPLVIGIGQGAALVRILGRLRVGIVWLAANVLASLVAVQMVISVGIGEPIPSDPVVLPIVAMYGEGALVYSAITGVALVAIFMTRLRAAYSVAV